MANPNSQFSPNLQNRYTNTQRSRHTKFDGGMMRDIASWELPEGAVYDAQDCLCDYVGKIRKRGGTTSPAAGNSAATVENLLSFKSNGVDALTGLWGSLGKAGLSIRTISSATGASTSVASDGSADCFACRPFQYGNLMVFPFQALSTSTNDRNRLYFAGGGTAASFNITAATVTALDNRITAVAPTSFVAGHLGSIIEVYNGDIRMYIGRIVSVTSTSAVRVEPTPTFSFAGLAGLVQSGFRSDQSFLGYTNTGRYGVSFQNRVVLGYTLHTNNDPTGYVNGIETHPNRVMWSVLPTESPTFTAFVGAFGAFPGVIADGSQILTPNAFPDLNYVDIPNLGGMTGLAAVGDGQLVVFGPRSMFRISGQLATETVANNSFSFSVDQISNYVGIPAATTMGVDDPSKSIQYAQGGVVFAGSGNIYLYDGSSMKPLLSGRNARYYQDRLRAGDGIYGSAYSLPKNHYYLSMSGTDGGLCIDLDNLSQTRWTGPTTQLFDAVPDPTNASKLWGPRWWDRTGAAPTMTKGQLIQVDPVWVPTSANKNDGDGTAVLSLVKTAAYVNGALASNKMTADLNLTADLRGSGSPTATVKADTKLNVSDASFTTLGTLPAGTAAGSKSFPLGNLVAEGPAVEIQIGNDVACDSFELLGLDFGTQGRPEEFST